MKNVELVELRGIEPLTSAVRLRPKLEFAAPSLRKLPAKPRNTPRTYLRLRYQCDTKATILSCLPILWTMHLLIPNLLWNSKPLRRNEQLATLPLGL